MAREWRAQFERGFGFAAGQAAIAVAFDADSAAARALVVGLAHAALLHFDDADYDESQEIRAALETAYDAGPAVDIAYVTQGAPW